MRVTSSCVVIDRVTGTMIHMEMIAQSPGVLMLGLPRAAQRANQKTAAMPIAAGSIGVQTMLTSTRDATIHTSNWISEPSNSLSCFKEIGALFPYLSKETRDSS